MRRWSSAVRSCRDFLLMRIVVVGPVRLAGLTVTVSMPVVSVSFVDTNVFLYAVSNAAEEREKSRIATCSTGMRHQACCCRTWKKSARVTWRFSITARCP